MQRSNYRKILNSLVASTMVIGQVAPIYAEDKTENVQVIKGDVYTYEASNVTRVSITDPEIADVSDAKKDSVLLIGKTSGQTVLFVWDDNGKHTVNVVVVNEDLGIVLKRINTLLEKAGIVGVEGDVDNLEGKVVFSGNLSKESKATFEKIIEPFSSSVMSLVKEEASEELIQIDMQITELSTTLTKNIGMDWANATGDAQLKYEENGVPFTGGSKDWFKIGQFNRTSAIVNTINLLISEGKARDLSRPRILVTSGKEATINVGGEVPIQSTTTNASGGATQSNTTFKQYGVTLTVTPTIKDGKIDIVMNAQVSDIDKTFPVTASTTSDIAYKTRSAQTQLMLDDRQTVVFAGLIRYSESEQVKSVPVLGKIPVVGALFRNRSNSSPNEGKELVITLTPTIMRKKEYVKDEIKLPTKKLVEFEKEVMKQGEFEKEALPPVPAKTMKTEPSAPAVKNENTVTTDYVRGIQEKIAKSISYPEEALANHLEGTVKLKLIIRKDGFLKDAAIDASSGQKIFDEDALNTAKSLVPYSAFPASLLQEEIMVTIPIVYNQGVK